MLTPETIEKMNAMKLFGLVSAFETQLSSSEYKELSFEERVGLLVDAEWTAREQRKLSRRLRAAKLRYPACLENVNFQAPRGLNREQILSLGNCRFVGERHNLLITGPTGIGKSFLACAFVASGEAATTGPLHVVAEPLPVFLFGVARRQRSCA